MTDRGWIPNWLTPGMNHFRQNTQGDANEISSPDMTGSQGRLVDCNPDGSATLEVRVCNRGTQPVGQGVPVAFYVGDPSATILACTAETQAVIPPGDCVWSRVIGRHRRANRTRPTSPSWWTTTVPEAVRTRSVSKEIAPRGSRTYSASWSREPIFRQAQQRDSDLGIRDSSATKSLFAPWTEAIDRRYRNSEGTWTTLAVLAKSFWRLSAR